MSSHDQGFDLLDWPGKAVAAVRDALAAGNIDAPGWLVQAVVLLAAIVLIVMFVRLWRQRTDVIARGGAAVCGIAALAIAVGVLWTWVDYLVHPLSGQVTGEVAGAPPERTHLQLVDYQGHRLGVVDMITGTRSFVVTYQPVFADPPAALVARADGCEDDRHELTRRHLQLGTPVFLDLRCTSG